MDDLEQHLGQVPGVGPVLAQTLIAWLPELGSLSRRAVVRDVLSMAVLAARRCNPVIARFADLLLVKKPNVILNAMVRDGTGWPPRVA